MKVPNDSIWPPSGWTFPVTPDVTLSAGSKQELVEKLAYWNTARGILTDPTTQINDYICQLYPHICRDVGASRPPMPATHLAARRAEYLNRVYRQLPRHKAVNDTEVQERLNSCKECPHFTLNVPACAPCGDNSTFLRQAITERFPVVGAEIPVAVCAVYGTDLPVALRFVVDSDETAPDGCWRKPRVAPVTVGPDHGAPGPGESGSG